jgi:hypothetical protein
MSAAAVLPPKSPELPLSARRLGYAGLLPFVLGALLVWLVHIDVRQEVAFALSAYAALVAAFLGGVHWGLAFRHDEPPAAWLGWGVVPLLVAWPALIMPPHAGLVVQGVLIAGCYLVDRRLYPQQGVARWLTLRFRLSAVASLCCFIGAAGA